MRRQWVWIVALLALMPVVGARGSPDDKDKANPPPTPAEQYRALVKDYGKAQQDFSKAYRAAKTDEERQAVIDKQYPKPQDYTSRFLKLAQDHPKDAAAFDALVWIVRSGQGTPDAEKAQEILVTDHIANLRLAQVCQALAYGRGAGAEKLLRRIMEKSPDKGVQGSATYTLAFFLKRQVADPENGAKADTERLFKEAEKLFERVIAEYGDIKQGRGTLAEQAKSQLDGLRNLLNLAIGKVVPETEGEDIDGKKFKLSDYRGKVVVLDFWGHW